MSSEVVPFLGQTTYPLNRPKSVRFSSINTTTLIFRTKHTRDEYGYRGFNLTYQSNSTSIMEGATVSIASKDSPRILPTICPMLEPRGLPAGKSSQRRTGRSNSRKKSPALWIVWYSSKLKTVKTFTFVSTRSNGTIEKIEWRSVFIILRINLGSFTSQVEALCSSIASLTRLHLLQIFYRGVGLSRMTVNCGYASHPVNSPWARACFACSSRKPFNVRLWTDRWIVSYTLFSPGSTRSPKADLQVLQHLRSFPFQITSSPTHGSYHNLTKVADQQTDWFIHSIGFRLVFGRSKQWMTNALVSCFDPSAPQTIDACVSNWWIPGKPLMSVAMNSFHSPFTMWGRCDSRSNPNSCGCWCNTLFTSRKSSEVSGSISSPWWWFPFRSF